MAHKLFGLTGPTVQKIKQAKDSQMKHYTTRYFGLMALIGALANSAHADVILFQDNFESGILDQWIGKSGTPHYGQIVADPLNPANHVLTFNGVNFAGDMFTSAPLNVSRPRQYLLKFDFLGLPGSGGNGGLIGIASAPTAVSQQFWIAGPIEALNVPPPVATPLAVDGQWHHYEIDFTALVTANGLTETLLMLEDWFDFGSVPGDAFFDNLSVVGVYDVRPILAQVPCEGPSPGKKWKNHGQYVSTVSKLADTYVNANIIAPEEAVEIAVAAGESTCGTKK